MGAGPHRDRRHARNLSFTGLGRFAAELVRDPTTDLLIAGVMEAEST